VNEKWTVTFAITRKKGDEQSHEESFRIDVDPDEYVLDGVERIWAFHDRSLTFRHACHHSTCGACGMRVNGVEKLTCITTIRSVTRDGGTLHLQPLRNFPVVSDLVVDMSDFYLRLDAAQFTQVADLPDTGLPFEQNPATQDSDYERLVDCIECGCCISACPIATTTATYIGPAVLAAIEHSYRQTGDFSLLDLADGEDGAWRCHSAFECSAVCPSNVDPGWRIMNLRRKIIGNRVRRFFGKQPQETAVK
jgi:succinate dehydrogenase / fumarate reductase iron-sulfur subunit